MPSKLRNRYEIDHIPLNFRFDPSKVLIISYWNEDCIVEDYYLWLKCMRWYNFANLGEILVDYTISHNPEYNPKIPQYACYNVIQMFRQQGLIK